MSRRKNLIITWLVVSLFTTFLAALILVLRKDYSTRGFSDATFVSGATMLFVFLFRLVTQLGTFDFVSYTFMRIAHSFKKKGSEVVESVGDYVENKRIERLKKDRIYIPYIVVSSLYIMAGAILTFI